MFRLLSLTSSGTERCFVEFLQVVLAGYGEGQVPDLHLQPTDLREGMDQRRLAIRISPEQLVLGRPYSTEPSELRVIQSLELPQLLAKRSSLVSLCDDLMELLRCLYESHGSVERQGHLPAYGDTPAQITSGVVSHNEMKEQLRLLLDEIRTRETDTLEIVLKENGMVSFYHRHHDQKHTYRPCRGRWYFRYAE